MKRQTYSNSSESALTLINSLLSLIESYVDMPPNCLKGCYKKVCVKEIDLFRVYIGNYKIGFTGGIQKQGSYQLLESQRLAMDRVPDCENYPQGAEGLIGDTRYGFKIATDANKNEDPSSSTRITKGAEGKVMGMERKRLKTEKKIQRKMKGIERARQAWAQKLRDDIKQRQHKQVRTLERVLRTSDPKIRTKIKYNNNGGKTERCNGPIVQRGVMSLEIFISTKREKITLVTKRTSKKAKCYGIYKRAKVLIKKRKGSEQKDWWKRPASCKMNTKRKIRKGSTDVYLLKRTIELEID